MSPLSDDIDVSMQFHNLNESIAPKVDGISIMVKRKQMREFTSKGSSR